MKLFKAEERNYFTLLLINSTRLRWGNWPSSLSSARLVVPGPNLPGGVQQCRPQQTLDSFVDFLQTRSAPPGNVNWNNCCILMNFFLT